MRALHSTRILITGGTGFVGCALLEYLTGKLYKNHSHISIYVTTRDAERFICKAPKLAQHEVVTLWLGSAKDVPMRKFDVILHLENCDIDTTCQIVLLAERARARLLYASSGAVYGDTPLRVDESHPCRPVTAYGARKVEAEKVILNTCNRATIARMFAFVGPYLPLDRNFAIGNFIGNGLRGEPILVQGDGKAMRSYLYSEELAEWLWVLALSDGGIYNVGSEIAVTVEELAHFVSFCFESKPEVVIKGDPSVPSSVYVPSVRKIWDSLRLSQSVDLLTAIHKTIEWNRLAGTR